MGRADGDAVKPGHGGSGDDHDCVMLRGGMIVCGDGDAVVRDVMLFGVDDDSDSVRENGWCCGDGDVHND